ncbi:hypothetical protein TNCV_1142231 [Trichonephila clavipes]|nr:hypothetical protein TNCV_1142231 [Trichonephila clavipes]
MASPFNDTARRTERDSFCFILTSICSNICINEGICVNRLLSSNYLRGCGSPVVKVSDHGRYVMSSSPVPPNTRRVGQRCTLNLSTAETSSRGVVVRRGVVQLRLSLTKAVLEHDEVHEGSLLVMVTKPSLSSHKFKPRCH